MENSNGTPKKNPNLYPPWQPGESGNPDGRPKGAKDGLSAHLKRLIRKDISAELRAFLESNKLKLSPGSYAKALAEVLLLRGLYGKLKAIEMIKAYTEDDTQDEELTIVIGEEISDDYSKSVAKLQANSASAPDAPEQSEVQGTDGGDSKREDV